MNYSEHSFRPLYKNFCLYKANETIKNIIKDQPGAEDADGVLVYGYADHKQGLLLEVIAYSHLIEEKKASFKPVADDVRITFKLEEVINDEFDFIAYGNATLNESFQQKIDLVNSLEKNEQIEQSRLFMYLDEFRHKQNIDEVMVLLNKNGLTPEGCWVRIEGLGNDCFVGKLLNEPEQDFGYHIGEQITFYVRSNEEGNLSLIANMNIGENYATDEFDNGEALRKAIRQFNANHNDDTLTEVLQIANKSDVCILCRFNPGEYQSKAVPEVLKMGDDYYFPVFTWNKEIGKFSQVLTKVRVSFMDAMRMANCTDETVKGIVIDAFTEAMIIPTQLFGVIENMKS